MFLRALILLDTQAGTEDPAVFQEAITQGYVANTLAGTPYLFGGNFYPLLKGLSRSSQAIVDMLGNFYPWHISVDKFRIFGRLEQKNSG